jgi:hypothetical protein
VQQGFTEGSLNGVIPTNPPQEMEGLNPTEIVLFNPDNKTFVGTKAEDGVKIIT